MKKLLTGAVLLFAFCFNLWSYGDWQKVVKVVSKSLVNVAVQENVEEGNSSETVSMGSGVVFEQKSDDYFFATININLEGLEHKRCFVVLPSGEQLLAEFVGKQESVNLAVYKFSADLDLDPLDLNEDKVVVGQDVCVVAAGLEAVGGLKPLASVGIVAKTDVALQEDVRNSFVFEVDANVTAGGLGGVVVDNSAEMLGFVIDCTSFPEGGMLQQPLILATITFQEITKRFVSDYRSGKTPKVSEEKLEPLLPMQEDFYGLVLRDMTQKDLQKYGLVSTEGVVIESVMTNSLGAKAGFEAGDLIIGAEKYRVSNVEILKKIEKREKKKGEISVVLFKDGARQRKVLPFEEVQSSQLPGLTAAAPAEAVVSSSEISVVSLSASQKKELDFGVMVSSLAANSAYDKAGLKQGDIIQEIQDVLVESKSQFEKELAKVNKGDRVLFYVVHADGSYGYVTVDL